MKDVEKARNLCILNDQFATGVIDERIYKYALQELAKKGITKSEITLRQEAKAAVPKKPAKLASAQKPECKSYVKPEHKAEIKPEPEHDIAPEPVPEIKPEINSDTAPEAKADPIPKPEPVLEIEESEPIAEYLPDDTDSIPEETPVPVVMPDYSRKKDEVECAICGRLISNKYGRKYCDDCKSHMVHNTNEYQAAQRRAGMYEGPKLYELKCHRCGKEFKTIWKLMFTRGARKTAIENGYVYCSRKCKEEDLKETLTCRQCGKTLKDAPGFIPSQKSTWFCDKKCKKAFEYEKAKKNHQLKTCPYCGKEFMHKSAIYCSSECREAAKKENPQKAVQQEPQSSTGRTVYQNYVCPVCGKLGVKEYHLKRGEQIRPDTVVTCSDECRELYRKISNVNYIKTAEKARAEQRRKEKERKQKEINRMGLCATCSATDQTCQRVRLGYISVPKGAVSDQQGRIRKCPNYRPGKKPGSP